MSRLRSVLHWTPRVLGILFVAFVSIFALDIFDEQLGFWGTFVGLFMHLIPSFVLIAVLWVGWRRPLVAGVAFLLLAAFYCYSFSSRGGFLFLLPIAGPAILIGLLFLAEYTLERHG